MRRIALLTDNAKIDYLDCLVSKTKPVTIPTSRLIGPELELAVAIADGRLDPHIVDGECLITHGGKDGPIVRFDAAWFVLQIMRRENAAGLSVSDNTRSGAQFAAGYMVEGEMKHEQPGSTPEESAMRAFVCKVLGDEVTLEVPV